MMKKTLTSLAFAAGCALAFGAMPAAHAQYYNPQVVTNGPQASRGDFGDWSSRRRFEPFVVHHIWVSGHHRIVIIRRSRIAGILKLLGRPPKL